MYVSYIWWLVLLENFKFIYLLIELTDFNETNTKSYPKLHTIFMYKHCQHWIRRFYVMCAQTNRQTDKQTKISKMMEMGSVTYLFTRWLFFVSISSMYKNDFSTDLLYVLIACKVVLLLTLVRPGMHKHKRHQRATPCTRRRDSEHGAPHPSATFSSASPL